jgi:uncharacterized protein YndB with AHSA1/START domain
VTAARIDKEERTMAQTRSKTEIVAEPNSHQILITREFAAPRELVFRAHVEPDLLAQWLGPRDMTMEIDHLDARHGGTWRYVSRTPDGGEYGFRGVFHGTPSVDGIVQTFEFEGMPGHVSLETLTLEERDGKTILRASSVLQSVEDRDGMIASGMETGVNEGYEKLDELLANLAPTR